MSMWSVPEQIKPGTEVKMEHRLNKSHYKTSPSLDHALPILQDSKNFCCNPEGKSQQVTKQQLRKHLFYDLGTEPWAHTCFSTPPQRCSPSPILYFLFWDTVSPSCLDWPWTPSTARKTLNLWLPASFSKLLRWQTCVTEPSLCDCSGFPEWTT